MVFRGDRSYLIRLNSLIFAKILEAKFEDDPLSSDQITVQSQQ